MGCRVESGEPRLERDMDSSEANDPHSHGSGDQMQWTVTEETNPHTFMTLEWKMERKREWGD